MGVQRTIIRPHPRDNQLSPIPVDFDPDTLGWILDEGGRGNLMLQNELFNTMEDTWERLRGNLNKLKNAVCKLPFPFLGLTIFDLYFLVNKSLAIGFFLFDLITIFFTNNKFIIMKNV